MNKSPAITPAAAAASASTWLQDAWVAVPLIALAAFFGGGHQAASDVALADPIVNEAVNPYDAVRVGEGAAPVVAGKLLATR